jgi:hypothetical protein
MATVLDPDTLQELRKLSPREAYDRMRQRVYESGATSSEDFREAYEQLVDHGILTWEQIEEFDS